MNHRHLALAAILAATALPGSAKTYCGSLSGREYDYRVPDAHMLQMVNNRHFTDDVEQGIKGSSGLLGGDLEYTLRVFPNHQRALNTLLRVAPRYPAGTIPGAGLPIECFFERAVRVYPDDSNAWLMYARFQFLKNKQEQAVTMLEKALALAPDDPTINYNLGLVYAKQKKFAQALPYAQKAYSLQFPLPGLKQMLVKAGAWVEPPPAEPKAEAPADAPAGQPAQPPAEPPSPATAPAKP